MTDTHDLHLPNEILYEIVGYVADEDILNLRLSAKIFHAITADRFAVTFFENRAYDMSLKGLEALVKITEQPTFARHIRTIVIGHGGKIYPGEHRDLLVQAFQNLANIGNTISLGLRQVRKCRNYRRRHHAVMRQTIKFFREKVIAAAVRARMPLGDLVADTQSASQNRVFPSVTDNWLVSFTREFSRGVVDHAKFNNLKIETGPTRWGSSSSGYILFNARDDRLEVSQPGSILQWYHQMPWYAMVLREVVLDHCVVESFYLLRMFEMSGHVLRRLSMYNVRLEPTPYRQETWMSLFAIRRTSLRVLESCKLGDLRDEADNCWLEGGDKTIEASTRAQVSTVLSNLAVGVRAFTLDDQ
jgi:hypothetical protein